MRRTAVALVASAFIAPIVTAASIAFIITIALVAITAEFIGAIAFLAIFAFKALARRATAVVTPFLRRFGRRRCTLRRCRCDHGRRIRTWLAEIVVAPSAPMVFALFARAGFAGGCSGRRAILCCRLIALMTLMAAAIVTRAALFRTSAGPPDFDHFGSGGWRIG